MIDNSNHTGVTPTPQDYNQNMLRITKRFVDEFGGVIVDGFPPITPLNPLPPAPGPLLPGRPKKTKSRTAVSTERGMF